MDFLQLLLSIRWILLSARQYHDTLSLTCCWHSKFRNRNSSYSIHKELFPHQFPDRYVLQYPTSMILHFLRLILHPKFHLLLKLDIALVGLLVHSNSLHTHLHQRFARSQQDLCLSFPMFQHLLIY